MFRVASYGLLSFGLRVKALPDYFDLIFRHLGVGGQKYPRMKGVGYIASNLILNLQKP
jgi:hypothetical protein